MHTQKLQLANDMQTLQMRFDVAFIFVTKYLSAFSVCARSQTHHKYTTNENRAFLCLFHLFRGCCCCFSSFVCLFFCKISLFFPLSLCRLNVRNIVTPSICIMRFFSFKTSRLALHFLGFLCVAQN